MKLYTYPGCTSSKKARRFLTERGVPFEEVNLKNGLSAAELDKLIGKRDYSQFFNPRNPVYREHRIKTDPPPREEALRLLEASPRAIRRPILVKGRKMILGFDPAEYEKLIS